MSHEVQLSRPQLKFCILFHNARGAAGAPLTDGTWWDDRRVAEKEAAKLQYQLSAEQVAAGCRYSVLPVSPGYRPSWRPVVKPAVQQSATPAQQAPLGPVPPDLST